jgi:hypothetical protein
MNLDQAVRNMAALTSPRSGWKSSQGLFEGELRQCTLKSYEELAKFSPGSSRSTRTKDAKTSSSDPCSGKFRRPRNPAALWAGLGS